MLFEGQRRQSGLKTGESWVVNVQQMEARSMGLRVSIPEFLFNIHKSLFLKSHHFGKCSYLILLNRT